jgi:riboflavin kinase / FMN adenylyltransferase
MELVRGLYNLQPRHRGCVATIGNYDGLHLGHQRLIAVLRGHAAALGLPACLISFEPTPAEFFAGDAAPARLTRFREKFLALRRAGLDRFVCLRFDARMQSLPATDFIDELLVRGLEVRRVVVGHDFAFGRQREGSAAMLRSRGARHGFDVEEVDAFELDGARVSSSRIREALAAGSLDAAARLLGRPYRMAGRVVAGLKLGRRLGFPTANLALARRRSPLAGVFAVRVYGAGLEGAPGVASLGIRPVVDGREPLLEVHVFDFEADLYRRHLEVEFLHRLRDERWFPSMEALVLQMREDAATARRLLTAAPAVD